MVCKRNNKKIQYFSFEHPDVYEKAREMEIKQQERMYSEEEAKQETQGYICPQTKKQCDDECCVSAEDCHIEASFGIISDCEPPKQEILEEVRVVKRTELYNSILSIVKQIPRKEVEGDAMDAPSCAYELQQLFLKWQQERMYSEEDMKEAFIEGYKQRAEKSDLIFDNASRMYAIHLFEQFKNK